MQCRHCNGTGEAPDKLTLECVNCQRKVVVVFYTTATVNRILGELLAIYEPDIVKRIEIGNKVCSLILADLDTRRAATQGEPAAYLYEDGAGKKVAMVKRFADNPGWTETPLYSQPVADRETIARIINPDAFYGYFKWQKASAYARADAILAAITKDKGVTK